MLLSPKVPSPGPITGKTSSRNLSGLSNTLFVGKVFHHLPEVGSTNDFALSLLSSNMKPADGTAVFTANQTAGRGQIGSRWLSEPGMNMALSIIFYPIYLKIGDQWLLSEAAALAAYDVLAAAEVDDLKIKWPNDLYAGDKKLGGILIQNSLWSGRIESSVVGIGLNVNQVDWPSEIPNPTSLKLETGRDFDPHTVAENLCACLERRFIQLKNSTVSLRGEYLKRLFRLGELSEFEADGRSFTGKISGVRPDGRLVVVETDGSESVWEAKQVKFRGAK